MKRMTSVTELHEKRWSKSASYQKAYKALEEEFSIAHALIKARADAELTQEQVADRMNTTQSAVARLESGSSNPSIALLRRYAKATGSQLKIDLIPAN